MQVFRILISICLFQCIVFKQSFALDGDTEILLANRIEFLVIQNNTDSVFGKQNGGISFFQHSKDFNSKRNALVFGGSAGLGSLVLGGLAYSWYSDYGTGNFHFFNDGIEWRGMDKIGHGVTAYFITDYVRNWYQWSGVNSKKSAWRGALTSLSFLTTIEVLDGFSDGWGFSMADMGSNIGGVGLFLFNNQLLKNSIFTLKYGYVPSLYREYRKELLGENELTALIKDYNGQSYWLSFNFASVFKSNKFPAWINLAVGYGAEGMLGGKSNPSLGNNGQLLPFFERYSQVFLSPDIDFNKIPTKNIYLKTLFRALSFYKFPFPALELNTKSEIKFNWLR